ncbi:hypothetical protein [Clostridium botulinum]|nr:hypothetical protein [Clostridium botulinum]
MKREIKNITIQLNEYNNLKSLKKIDATLFDKEIENLAYNINKKDNARTNKNGSTGLGLFISKSLMEKMNGEIYAEVHENLLHIFCEWNLK